MDDSNGKSVTIDNLHERHRILSRSRCSCGWEGDSFTTHIIDTLRIRETCWLCGHAKRHINHVPFKGPDWHDYRPVLVSHIGSKDASGGSR